MTTIIINENIEGLPKTNFNDLEDLIRTSKEIAPVKLCQVDEDEFPPDVLERLEKSKNNPENKSTFIVTEISDHQ
ncbi:MAG: hypothetical protein JEY97_11415 [Bacteroidales bacterium]|nr:hypothetical protein [Bacteroidales bacterium]